MAPLAGEGGVYADVDTECVRPLDELLLPSDTLVVGWENAFDTAQHAYNRNYARIHQLLQVLRNGRSWQLILV